MSIDQFIASRKHELGQTPLKRLLADYRRVNPDATRSQFVVALGSAGLHISTQFGRQWVIGAV